MSPSIGRTPPYVEKLPFAEAPASAQAYNLETATAPPQGPAPERITIPAIGVDAAVQAKGRDPQNYPEVPDSGSDVAWYTFTAAPGRGSNAVFSGHVDWYYWGKPGEGVFYHLRELQIGDEITVDLADGNQVRYRVT